MRAFSYCKRGVAWHVMAAFALTAERENVEQQVFESGALRTIRNLQSCKRLHIRLGKTAV
jgi:hypothetical protein